MKPTTLAVLSDVHGNLPALRAVLADIDGRGVERTLVAGDLLGGPKPNQVIDLLRSRGSTMIAGNADLDVLRYAQGQAPAEWGTIKQFGLIRWTHQHLRPDLLEYLASLPQQRVVQIEGAPSILMVHGSPRDPYESLFPDRQPEVLATALQHTPQDVLLCGHIHVPWSKRLDGKLVCNPGAVCAPLNGQAGAHYALLHLNQGAWTVEHRRLDYDLDEIRKDFSDSGLLEAGGGLARAFLFACESGRNVIEAFFKHAFELAAAAGEGAMTYLSDAIWEQASAAFPWDGAP